MIRHRRSQPDIDAIRQGAPARSPTVRTLHAFAAHSSCHLAALGFAAQVDFEQILVGTPYQAPYGQSPFAFTRGRRFEEIVRAKGYGDLLVLLRERLGFGVSDVRVVNLRDGFPKNREGMVIRAHETKRLVRDIVRGDSAAPNLIDGAVLSGVIGGVAAYFEADDLAFRIGLPIHGAEMKSFPIVDGRADKEKLAAAFDQVSVYLVLLRQLIDGIGGDPALVSSEAILIAPKGVGLQPTIAVENAAKRIDRIERLLARVPTLDEVLSGLPAGTGFAGIAPRRNETASDVERRVDALHDLVERVGTAYVPECLSSCGLARFCRYQAFQCGARELIGSSAVRLLPNIPSLSRAEELTRGAPARSEEIPVAAPLARAARLYDECVEQAAGGRRW